MEETEGKEQNIRELIKSESKYRHLFEKSPIAIYVTDRQGRILNINQSGVKLFGYDSKEDMVGKVCTGMLLDRESDEPTIADTLKWTDIVKDFETQLQREDGKLVDVQVTAASRTGLVGKQEGYEGFILDITDRAFH